MPTPPEDILEFNGEWHTAVPDSLIQNDNLSMGAKLFWICVKSYASPNSPRPFPGRDTICRLLGGIGETSFWRYKTELIKAGWLRCQQEPGHLGKFGRSIYTILSGVNDNDKSPGSISPGSISPVTAKRNPKEYPGTTLRVPKGEGAPGFSAKLYPRELDLMIRRAEEEIEALKCSATPDRNRIKELRSRIKSWRSSLLGDLPQRSGS